MPVPAGEPAGDVQMKPQRTTMAEQLHEMSDQLKNEVDWPNSEMAIQVQLSGMYVQATGFGPVISVKSIGLRTASAECPFEYLD